ncbi:MAG: prepilin-type N-terminal cleavage/methylation domain-containing protein [Candidatus Omnitrophota bacterium]
MTTVSYRNANSKAVTLLEILVVVVIVAILAALGLPRFSTMKERALDKEAGANLKLIQAAEKIYRMENSIYYPSGVGADTTAINTVLRLSLPSANWSYTIPDTGGGGNFDGRATRDSPPAGWGRNWRIDFNDENACCCPRALPCLTADWCASCP